MSDLTSSLATEEEVNLTALTVTLAAHQKIAMLIQEEAQPGLKLRIYVEGGGCSGFQYGFSFEETAEDDDLLFHFKSPDPNHYPPIEVVIDVMSAPYLAGAEVDYQNDVNGERFIIKNPNAKTTCGCGSSFSAD